VSELSPERRPIRREPVFNLPGVIVATIAVLVLIHAWREYGLDVSEDGELLRRYAFVPGRFTAAFDMDAVAAYLTSISRQPDQLAVARYFLEDGSAQPWSLMTYAGLHGDWLHLGVNCLWVAAFGGPVAMRLGTLRFLTLFALAAVAGALFYYLFHRNDFIPMVGASAAISGVMAAAIRFVFQPGAPLGPPLYGGPLPSPIAARLRAVTLRESLTDKRVIQFTLTWFAINFVFGIAAAPLGITASAIAWEAHAGGFIAGFLLFGLIDPPSIDPAEITQWQYPHLPPNDSFRA
jgi:membrane associated rhomboid family serine protease